MTGSADALVASSTLRAHGFHQPTMEHKYSSTYMWGKIHSMGVPMRFKPVLLKGQL